MKSNHELHKYVPTMLWLKLFYEYTKGCPIKVQH